MAASIFKKLVGFSKGIKLKTSEGNVHDSVPTAAQLATEFSANGGTPAQVQIVNDAAGGTNIYLAVKIGSVYAFQKLTVAS